jgi:hypothetical protein
MDYPPQPRLTLSIGVIGHRPNRLAKADLDLIESEVERVMGLITHEVDVVHRRYDKFFQAEAPQLCVVSALAEGADRIVAKAALARNFVLDVPIPFLKDEYARDFSGAATQDANHHTEHDTVSSLEEFEALTADSVARSLLQLPGKRADRGRVDRREADMAYEMAGLTVIGQSDILLTVWDGGPSGGAGGTADMLHQAVRRGVPIIEINIFDPANTRIRWSSLRESPIAAEQIEELPSERFELVLPRLIEEFLRPPSALSERDTLLSYIGASPVKRRFATWWAELVGTRRRLAASAAAHASQYRELMEATTRDTSLTLLATAFGWADVMAIHSAKNFRRAFVFNFFLSATAVVAALSSLLLNDKSSPYYSWPPVIEIVLIVLVLVNTAIGRKFGWHLRWLEARELAERMRVAILFWILGAQPPAFFGEEPAWTGWYARAINREQGMRRGCLDRDGMSAARAAMLHVLEHQHDYHCRNSRKMKRREVRLERIGQALFALTLLLAIAHVSGEGLIDYLFHDYPRHHEFHIILTAILPTLATATYGIRLIGDFEGIAKRSERTELGHLRVIEALRRDPADLMLFRARAQIIADAMLGDVSSWRLSAESRGLAVPG